MTSVFVDVEGRGGRYLQYEIKLGQSDEEKIKAELKQITSTVKSIEKKFGQDKAMRTYFQTLVKNGKQFKGFIVIVKGPLELMYNRDSSLKGKQIDNTNISDKNKKGSFVCKITEEFYNTFASILTFFTLNAGRSNTASLKPEHIKLSQVYSTGEDDRKEYFLRCEFNPWSEVSLLVDNAFVNVDIKDDQKLDTMMKKGSQLFNISFTINKSVSFSGLSKHKVKTQMDTNSLILKPVAKTVGGMSRFTTMRFTEEEKKQMSVNKEDLGEIDLSEKQNETHDDVSNDSAVALLAAALADA